MSKDRLIIRNNQKEDSGGVGGLTERESNTVIFDGDYVIGNASIRDDSVIEFDFTNAKLGAVTTMRHLRSLAPGIPLEGVIINGEYVPNTINYIWFCLTKNTTPRIVQITIGQ